MKVIFTSDAQFRMLGRLCRGFRLPVTRYRMENPTLRSLMRKGLAYPKGGAWEATPLGHRVRAARNGFLVPDGEAVRRVRGRA